jgi:hypothetical protein
MSATLYNRQNLLSSGMKPTHDEYPKVKKGVSEIFRQNDTAVDNFQLENMRHKMKRIKEAKKKKSTNYKKIETLEILDNDPAITKSPPYTEGFEPGEYEGHDTVNEPSGGGLSLNIKADIESAYKWFISSNTYIAQYISTALSGGRSTENDVNEIQNYIAWLESALVGSYIVYNWYFLMYYATENSIELIKITRADFRSSNIVLNEIMTFFEYLILFPEMMNWLIVDIIPAKIGVYLSGPIKFSLLYVILLYCVKNFAPVIKDILVESFTFNKNSTGITSYMVALLVIVYIYAFIDETKRNPLPLTAVKIGMMFFYNLIRLTLSILGCIYTGGIILSAYLLLYSFFAIWWYGGGKITFDMLDLHATRPSPIQLNPCEDNWFIRILKLLFLFITGMFTTIKKHLFLIVLFCIVLFSSSSLYSKLSDVRSFMPGILFRDVIGIYNALIMFVIASIIWSRLLPDTADNYG